MKRLKGDYQWHHITPAAVIAYVHAWRYVGGVAPKRGAEAGAWCQ